MERVLNVSYNAGDNQQYNKIFTYLRVINFLFNLTPTQMRVLATLIDSDPGNPLSREAKRITADKINCTARALNMHIHALKKAGCFLLKPSGKAENVLPVLTPFSRDLSRTVSNLKIVLDPAGDGK